MSDYYKEVNLTVSNYASTISPQLAFYNGDHGLDIAFLLQDKPYRVGNKIINLINSYNNNFVDIRIIKPDGTLTERKNLEITDDNKVVLTIDDELTGEIGTYTLQFFIGNKSDDTDTSMFALPEFTYPVKPMISATTTGTVYVITDAYGNTLVDENGTIFAAER